MSGITTIDIDGEAVEAPLGQPLAAILHRRGAALRHSVSGRPRGLYCGMGVCFECAVRVDGRLVRSCIAPVRPGMSVETNGERR